MYVLLGVCTTQCMHHLVYAILGVYTTRYRHCSVYALLGVCSTQCTWCMLCLVLTHDLSKEKLRGMTKLHILT